MVHSYSRTQCGLGVYDEKALLLNLDAHQKKTKQVAFAMTHCNAFILLYYAIVKKHTVSKKLASFDKN